MTVLRGLEMAMTRTSGVRRALTLLIPVLLVLATWPYPASAATQYTWTTTADFDSGSSVQGTDYGVGIGYDQPIFGYISKPSAIYSAARQRTYVGFQGFTTYLLAYMTYFDHVTKAWATPVAVGPTYDPIVDGHGAPSIYIDGAGYLYSFWGSHATAQKLSKSVRPHDISAWTQLNDPCSAPCTSTYPSVFSYGGKIYFYHRQAFAQGGPWRFHTSTNGGVSWTVGTDFLQFPGTDGAYFGGHIQEGSSLWYSFAKYEDATSARRNIYTCRWDLTTDIQYGVDGTNLGATVNLTEADTECLVFNTGTDNTGWASIVLDSLARPFVLWNQGTNTSDIEFRSSRWNGSAWTIPLEFQETDAGSNYGTLLYHSDTDIDAFVTAAGFREINSCCDDFGGTLEHWNWNGTAWNVADDPILTEALAGIPVNRPFVPLNHVPEMEIIFDAWVPNTLGAGFEQKYGFDTNGREQVIGRVYGWGTSGLLVNGAVSSVIPGVQTSTDNPNIVSGVFALADSRRDPFAYEGDVADHAFWQQMRSGDGDGNTTMIVTGGKLVVQATDNSGTGRLGETLISKFGIEGDADVRIKFEETDPGTGVVLYGICLWNQSDSCDSAGVFNGWYGDEATFGTTGIMYRHIYGVSGAIEAFTTVNGINLVGQGSVGVTCDSCWMRITRSGGTLFNVSYSLNGVSYVQTDSVSIPELDGIEPLYAALSASCNACTSGDWTISMDDWNMASGNIRNGWRARGAWTSPVIAWAGIGEVARNVTVTFSGASATRYIDSVAIVSSSGAVLYENTTDITSGSTVFYDLGTSYTLQAALSGHDFHVRVSLAGDTFGTMTVSAVSLWTVRSEALQFVDDAIDIMWLILFAMVLIAIVTAAWYVKRYRGV